jgi:MFS family permease
VESHDTGRNGEERSASELVKDLSRQSSELIRQEMELAKAELREKGRAAGIGAGMFGGAGLLGLYALGALTAGAILGLAEAVDGWLAALIVAAIYAAIAGILALTGKKNVEEATPPVPERAVDSAKADVEEVKRSAKEARA